MRPDDSTILGGTVEIDETLVGGKRHGKRGRGAEGKASVFGMIEREGELKAEVVENLKAKTLIPIIVENIEKRSTVYTDEFQSYSKLENLGFKHDVVKHSIKEYVRGKVHVNSLEGFWSQLKRSIDGTHHAVSIRHLQLYVDEFAWTYNHRDSSVPIFHLLL
jgi:hypothetical protein